MMLETRSSIELSKLTEEEFKKFADLIYNLAGIYLKDSKLTLLSNRLRKRLKDKQMSTFNEYFNYIQRTKDEKEISEMLNAVSTNETYFFRSPQHFDTLVNVIIPDLIKNKRTPVRIWSAGCSTGEEPFTIAMVLNENGYLDKRYVEIIASDINTEVIADAQKAIFDVKKLRSTPEYYKNKYFVKIDQYNYLLNKDIVNFVKFNRINLNTDKFPERFDIIFCRNVMIYFDKEVQKIVVNKFYNALKDKGYLFIGHSESLYFINNDFKYEKILDAPVYSKGN